MNKKTLRGRESLNKYLEISGKFYALSDYKSYSDAYIAEKNILRLYKEYLAEDVHILDSGNTELFTKDVLQMNHLNVS